MIAVRGVRLVRGAEPFDHDAKRTGRKQAVEEPSALQDLKPACFKPLLDEGGGVPPKVFQRHVMT